MVEKLVRTAKELEQINHYLGILMLKKPISSYIGKPYISEDGSFGVKCGTIKGGLHSAYFLVDKLAEAGLFTGKQAKGTDLDAAIYNLHLDATFQIYPEVSLYWNKEKELEVKVATQKSTKEVIEAILVAVKSADADIQEEKEKKEAHIQELILDKKKEAIDPIVSAADDACFVLEYLQNLMEQKCPNSDVRLSLNSPKSFLSESFTASAEKYLSQRPCFVIEYDQNNEEKFSVHNELGNDILPDIFKGWSAVHHYSPNKEGIFRIEVEGSPSRLRADIIQYGEVINPKPAKRNYKLKTPQ